MTENKAAVQKKTARERSAAYPAIPLEQSVAFSAKLQGAFGKSPFSRESAVKEMGYKTVTGTSGASVAALVHYGLLNREGNAYRNSDLSLRMAHPIDDDDSKAAVKTAAFTPKLYKSLLAEFAGRAVPTALSSILIQHHKISRKVADDVANTFRKTIEYAGFYPNGIVSSELPVSEEVDTSGGTVPSTTSLHPAQQNPTPPGSRVPAVPVPQGMLTVELPSGIVVSYPKHLGFVFAKIAALENAVQEEMKKHEPSATKDSSSSTE